MQASEMSQHIEYDASGCWLWTGALNHDGYGVLNLYRRGKQRAHRVMYEALVGPIPDGLVLDHLCGVRRCVNVAHLEPVRQRTNLMRSDATLAHRNAITDRCKAGHLFTVENTKWKMDRGRPWRQCKTCRRDRERERYAAAHA